MKIFLRKIEVGFTFFIAVFLVNLFNINLLRAQNVGDIINQQDWISRNQQNKVEEASRAKERELIRKERALKKEQSEESSEENLNILDNGDKNNKNHTAISKKSTECFLIKSINLINSKNLSLKDKQELIGPFINQCLEAKNLTNIIDKIQNFYASKGFIATRILVPKQNIQNGNLDLEVLSGKVNDIIVGADKFTDKMQEFTAFGFLEGRDLNLNDINQGIYQMNRLSSNNAIIKIEPSNKDGAANIYVANQKKFPARATIGYDNIGNDFTGIYRTNFSGVIDNALFLNDAINLSYSTNFDDKNSQKNNESFLAGISIPFAYATFSFDYSRSKFRGTNVGISGLINLTGYSERNNALIDYVLFNKGNLRVSTSASITTKSSASYLNNEKIETSERKLTIGNIGFTIANYFKNGVNLYLKPSYSKGLKILNGKQDENGLTPDIPRAQFNYLKLYGSLSKKFIIPNIETPLIFITEMDSQYARQTLFGTEQFSIGGYYSVRGFRENYINGDSGYYFRNKINLNIGSALSPFVRRLQQDESKIDKNWFAKNIFHLNKLAIEPFYDYGYIKNKYVNHGADGRISGLGIKTIFSNKYLNASLTYSWARSYSQLITSTIKENKLIFFEVSANCC